MVAGDFIGHQPVFLIVGDSEKRLLFHVVRGGKERKRREEREKKKRRKRGKEERKRGKERRKGGEGKGKKERENMQIVWAAAWGDFFFKVQRSVKNSDVSLSTGELEKQIAPRRRLSPRLFYRKRCAV